MTAWSKFNSTDREQALAEATAKLTELGFASLPNGSWEGSIAVDDGTVTVRVRLPNGFPDSLPEVFLADPDNAPIRCHVEQSGKVCIATTSGNLLDVDRPSALITDALSRVRSVLTADIADQVNDLQLEFVSYWPERQSDIDFLSIANPSRSSREIIVSDLALNGNRLIFADSEDQLKSWVDNACAGYANINKTFLARLTENAAPPKFAETLSTNQFDEFLSKYMSETEYNHWRKWDNGRRPPPAILLSKPLPDGSWAVFAIRPAELTAEQKRTIQNPYSRKKPPAKKIRLALQENPIRRFSVTRADPAHLLRRTIGSIPFEDLRLAILGCGAVGSQIAVAAVATGASSIALVDKERLGAENIHRHVLGANDIGRYKAIGLAAHLLRRYPHVTTIPKPVSIEELLDVEDGFFDEIDLAVFALGEETLERRLNRFLGNSIVRMHAWVEPLGLGGHCLVVPGNDHKGCFECLYSRDQNGELYNMAALSAPGQSFQRTTGGCAGTFTPFGYADTLVAAAQAVRTLIRISNAHNIQHELVSWICDEHEFTRSGYALSIRGESLLTTRKERRDDIARIDCGVCSHW